jgi:hypothetical protein
MNMDRRGILFSALLWVALNPLPANAQIKADPSWLAGLGLSFTGTATPSGSAWIDIDDSVSDTDEKSRQESRKPFPWRNTPPDSPDWKGAARDTVYFMVYQTIVIGLLYVAPESISGWSDEDKENYDSGEWEDNVQDPHRDTDTFFVNYILHPYWGATYYVRGRERGLTRPQSFLFSATLSALYEFGLEAMFEQPSYQDLWITPVVGSLVGEYWFTPVRNSIKAQPGELTWQDKTILFLPDPLGVLSTGTDRLLGLDTKVQVHAFHPGTTQRLSGQAGSGNMALLNRLPVRAEPAYGLQLRIDW